MKPNLAITSEKSTHLPENTAGCCFTPNRRQSFEVTSNARSFKVNCASFITYGPSLKKNTWKHGTQTALMTAQRHKQCKHNVELQWNLSANASRTSLKTHTVLVHLMWAKKNCVEKEKKKGGKQHLRTNNYTYGKRSTYLPEYDRAGTQI